MALSNPTNSDLLVFVVVGILALAINPSNVMSQCACATGNLCCSRYGFCDTGDQFCGEGCQAGPCTIPTNDVVVADLVTPAFFDGIKNQATGDCPGRSFYTRDAFLNAVNSYPRFCRIGTVDDSKREIAAFFAHVTQETGFMCFIEEQDKSSNYCTASPTYPCVEGKFYYGRGPLQLTGNENYGAAGEALQFDGLNAPETVATDPNLAFKTALFFWQANVHTEMKNGFGATIRQINGPKECDGVDPEKVQNRITYYSNYCQQLGVDPGQNLSC